MKSSALWIIILAASLLGCGLKTGDTLTFEGKSMLPGILDGERLTVERFEPDDKIEFKRGDVIAFKFPPDPTKFYLKRLIGLPNETVEIREGVVVVNGNKLEEPYVDPKFNLSRSSYAPLVVKEHHYYVLGDNRDMSSDSRFWGLVPEKYIFARVISP